MSYAQATHQEIIEEVEADLRMSISVAKTEDETSMRAHKKALLLAAEVATEQLIFEIEYMQKQKQTQKQAWAYEEQVEELAEQEDYETWMLNAHRSIYDETVCPCVSMSPIFSDTMNEYFCCKECNAKRQRIQRLLKD